MVGVGDIEPGPALVLELIERDPFEGGGRLLWSGTLWGVLLLLVLAWARSAWLLWLGTGRGVHRLTARALLEALRIGSAPEWCVVALPVLVLVGFVLLLCRR